MNEPLEALYHDNRGDTYAFGYVYFNDGTRVGYAVNHGVFRGGGWGGETATHYELAVDFLAANGITVTT